MEYASMHHPNMVRDVVAGLQEVLQQEQVPTGNPTVIEEPVDHVANTVQNIQKQLDTQLKKMKAMMKAMVMKYAAGTKNSHQYYGGREYHRGNANYRSQGGRSA